MYKIIEILLERLHEYLQFRRISYNKLEKSIGVSHGSISNARKHGKNIGSNVITAILDNYQDLNAEWLLRGSGRMLKNSETDFDVKSLVVEKEYNEWLISETVQYLNLQSKRELVDLLTEPATDTNNSSIGLEDKILSTWEKKYGQELESIKLQLMTLFMSKLDSEKISKSASNKSKKSS